MWKTDCVNAERGHAGQNTHFQRTSSILNLALLPLGSLLSVWGPRNKLFCVIPISLTFDSFFIVCMQMRRAWVCAHGQRREEKLCGARSGLVFNLSGVADRTNLIATWTAELTSCLFSAQLPALMYSTHLQFTTQPNEAYQLCLHPHNPIMRSEFLRATCWRLFFFWQ